MHLFHWLRLLKLDHRLCSQVSFFELPHCVCVARSAVRVGPHCVCVAPHCVCVARSAVRVGPQLVY